MYKRLIRPILFVFDPELIHHVSFFLIKVFMKIPGMSYLSRKLFFIKSKSLEKEIFGIKFPNPVGLAAGFDKNAELFHELSNFGFGFIEIGTVTPKPQPGNKKKRVFRLNDDSSLINRLGFNNKGIDYVINNLKDKGEIIVGGNIGKNKNTPNEKAINDYIYSLNALYDYVDYFVVNVSSPNTPNLRNLQEKKPLTALVKKLCEERLKKSKEKPLLLKISPDLSEKQLLDIISVIETENLDGVIATNTTIKRENLESNPKIISESGGLSGKKLTSKSNEVIRFIHKNSNGSFPIIGVGGIFDAEDVLEKIECGASLVQIYTGFIYEGPSIVKTINKKLIRSKINS
ncbi:MAG: quinone-dependent dihydroorotate dehydrogenase [Flavobacteriaceae bacterium]|tara:strand:- start:14365 stop:15399 length:1035 start_codon:yes stop_codon:yes gene_type:complete